MKLKESERDREPHVITIALKKNDSNMSRQIVNAGETFRQSLNIFAQPALKLGAIGGKSIEHYHRLGPKTYVRSK